MVHRQSTCPIYCSDSMGERDKKGGYVKKVDILEGLQRKTSEATRNPEDTDFLKNLGSL